LLRAAQARCPQRILPKLPPRLLPKSTPCYRSSSPLRARLSAANQKQAKKAIQHVDVPPIRSATIPTEKSQEPVISEVYTQDGDFIKDIEVNDLRNRYTLTKGATQKMVNSHFVMTH